MNTGDFLRIKDTLPHDARVSCTCENCGKEYYRNKKNVLDSKRHMVKFVFACSAACMSVLKGSVVSTKCSNCGKEIQKQSNEIKKSTSGHTFCCQSCAAKFSLKGKPSHNKGKTNERYKKPSRKCSSCEMPLSEKAKGSICMYCIRASVLNRTKKDFWTPRAPYSLIRSHARMSLAKHPKVCKNCGYSKHVEACHIKGINKFPDDALVSEINQPDNLVWLCPNCHWELDHGHLDPETLKGKEYVVQKVSETTNQQV